METTVYCRFQCELIQGNSMHGYNTRVRNDFRVSQHRTTAFERLPSQIGIKLLNILPESLKNLENPILFKRELKRDLVRFAFYTEEEFTSHHWG